MLFRSKQVGAACRTSAATRFCNPPLSIAFPPIVRLQAGGLLRARRRLHQLRRHAEPRRRESRPPGVLQCELAVLRTAFSSPPLQYQMSIFDPAPVRPQACIDADPLNVNCQLAGPYTINLWGVGTVRCGVEGLCD